MADATDTDTYLDTICYPVERYLLGFAVRDKERLISALISNALLNERLDLNGSGPSMLTRAWKQSGILSWTL